MKLQQYRLDLIKAVKLSGNDSECSDESAASISQSLKMFGVVCKLRLVPKFDERDPDTFSSLFDHVAYARG